MHFFWKLGSPQKIINRAKRRTDYFRMGRAEAQVACQFNAVVLTFATLLPNASDRFLPVFLLYYGGVYKNRQESLAFEVGEEEVRVIYFLMSKVVRRVISDEAVLTIATAQRALLPNAKVKSNGNYCTLLQETESNVKVRFPRIVPLHRLSRKWDAVWLIVHYWEAVRSSGKVPIPRIVSLHPICS